MGQHRPRRSGRLGFGCGPVEAPEGEVVRALGHCLMGQVQTGMAGGPQNGVFAQQAPGFGQRAVPLAKMSAGGANASGELGIVVDDQGDPGVTADRLQFGGLA